MNSHLKTILITLSLCVLLSACNQGNPPSHTEEVAVQGLYSAALSHSGRFGSIGSIHHGGSYWDLDATERLYNWNHQQGGYSGLTDIAFSPDDNYVATTDRRSIVLWDVANGQFQNFWSAPGEINSIALSPNGNFSLLGLDDYTAVYFDIKNGGIVRTLSHERKVNSVDLSHDARFAITGSDDFTAKLWDMESGELLHNWQHDNQVKVVALSASGKYAFSSGYADNGFIWDTKSGKQLQIIRVKYINYISGTNFTTAVFSPEENQLLVGTSNRSIQLWDITNGTLIEKWIAAKKEPFKPSSTVSLALAFGANNEYHVLTSNGLYQLLKR